MHEGGSMTENVISENGKKGENMWCETLTLKQVVEIALFAGFEMTPGQAWLSG